MGRRQQRRSRTGHPLRTLLIAAVLIVGVWCASLYVRITRVSREDQAAPADAIAVFGAAQYVGHPSPVLHARLDHAISLYRKGLAPLIITLGGAADDRTGHSEGGVGRDYLLAHGIPLAHIIAETESVDTEQQVMALAALAGDRHLRRVIAVSDGTHLFRIRELCRHEGLDVLTSPRASFGTLSAWGQVTRVAHEMLSYSALDLHLQAGWVRRWISGREEE